MLINIEKIDFKRHPLFSSSNDMQELAEPLSKYNIIHFGYTRIDADDGYIHLTNAPEFSETFLKQNFYKRYFCDHYSTYQSGIFLADLMNFDTEFMQALHGKHLGHISIITKKHKSHTEIFYFGTHPQANYMNQFYINKQDLLETFCKEFKEKGNTLFKRYSSQRLIYNRMPDKSGLTDPALLEKILPPQKINILTIREHQCLEYLKQGYSAKMIANKLNISPRTVEHHLAHIREKFNTSSIKKIFIKNY